jgi:hypothetical protein
MVIGLVIIVMMVIVRPMVVVRVVMTSVVVIIMVMRRVIVMFARVMFGVMRLLAAEFIRMFFGPGVVELFGQRLCACFLDDSASNPIAMAAPTRIAMARAAAAGAVFRFFLGLAMGALVGLDQCLTVGDRDLVIVGMDFAEGEKAVTVAAIFDEGSLQRRFDPRHLGEIDIAAQLFALRGLEIKFFDAVAAYHDDPGLLRVGGVDQHLVGHIVTLDGGGRVRRRGQTARPGDATVHLIRG